MKSSAERIAGSCNPFEEFALFRARDAVQPAKIIIHNAAGHAHGHVDRKCPRAK